MFRPETPFPFTMKTGAVVTDERCKCGALRSEHENTIAYGHGARIVGDVVTCERYTFVSWVFTSSNMVPGFQPLDDKHAIKIERANKRGVGAKGWRYEIRDLSKPPGKEQRVLTCTAPTARTRAQALEHARTELQVYLERRAGMTVLRGGVL